MVTARPDDGLAAVRLAFRLDSRQEAVRKLEALTAEFQRAVDFLLEAQLGVGRHVVEVPQGPERRLPAPLAALALGDVPDDGGEPVLAADFGLAEGDSQRYLVAVRVPPGHPYPGPIEASFAGLEILLEGRLVGVAEPLGNDRQQRATDQFLGAVAEELLDRLVGVSDHAVVVDGHDRLLGVACQRTEPRPGRLQFLASAFALGDVPEVHREPLIVRIRPQFEPGVVLSEAGRLGEDLVALHHVSKRLLETGALECRHRRPQRPAG